MGVRHENAKKNQLELLKAGQRVITIGGGHDYGYPDTAGFLDYCKKLNSKPLIINFDAHLDVRPTTNGLSSGTPFYRLLTEYEDFNFAEIGIQQLCNTKKHYNFCIDKACKVILFDEFQQSGASFVEYVCQQLHPWLAKTSPTFISIDIDMFSAAFAPGCSQAWPNAVTPEMFFPLFDLIIQRMEVLSLGIYEVSPPLDHDNITSKLAAQIMHHFVSRYEF